MVQKRKKILKKIFNLFLILFIITNVLAIIQAYSFTHFKEDNSKTDFKLGISTLFTGVNIPKPHSNILPDRKFQTLKIPSGENKFLEAWLLNPKSDSKGLVILFHGFRAEKSSMLDHAYVFLDLDYRVMLVDFMGAGNSYGNQNTIGYLEAQNVKQSYEFAVHELKEKTIILCGFSMGAAAIVKAQHDYNLKVDKIILEAVYGKMSDAAKIRLNKIPYVGKPFSYLITFWGGMLNGFNAFSMNPEEYIKKVSVPTLILCGGKDPRIPVKESERIFQNSGSKEKKFKIFSNSFHHSYLKLYPEEWKKTIQDFLN